MVEYIMIKNKNQSWKDYIKGIWKCPKCKTVWDGGMAFYNFRTYTVQGNKTTSRLECVCGYVE